MDSDYGLPVKKNFRLSKELDEKIKRMSKKYGISYGKYIRLAIKFWEAGKKIMDLIKG